MPERERLGRVAAGIPLPAMERTLPVFERIAPTPPLALLADRIEALTRPGEVVLDVASRGGWTARAAIDRDRRAVVVESDPLTRLLAEVVLRPPDLRHLDAAFQAIAAAPRRQSSLKRSIEESFATRCPHCGRTSSADELIWEGPPATARPVRKQYRCLTCRQGAGTEVRHEPTDEADAERAAAAVLEPAVRTRLRDRFRVPAAAGDSPLPDELLGLHTPRQLAGLAAILERIETDLRAPEVEAALRLAFLHAIPPCTRLNAYPGRAVSLRISGGRLRQPTSAQWRERNPWLAFEEGMRLVRGFIGLVESGALFSAPAVEVAPAPMTVESDGLGQAVPGGPLPPGAATGERGAGAASDLHGGGEAPTPVPSPAPGTAPTLRSGPVHPRFGTDIRSLADRAADVVVRVATPYGLEALAEEAASMERMAHPPRIRLFVGEVPRRANTERLSLAYAATCWTLGRDAASFLDLDPLFGPSPRIPWGSHAALVARNLGAAAPLMAPDGRALLLVDLGGAEGLVAAVLGGVAAGYRLGRAELHAPDQGTPSLLELVPPGGLHPGGPRTRANVPLPPVPGGAGDRDRAPSRRVFAATEPVTGRPFSSSEVGRTVTEAVVRALQARGEPADFETLLGGVLVELDRAGHLRRLVEEAFDAAGTPPDEVGESEAAGAPGGPGHGRAAAADPLDAADSVARLLAAIRGELERSDHRRLETVAPGTWWLADRDDRAAAEVPLADRLEWSVFSLLTTSGALPEVVVRERAARLVGGLSEGDDPLLDACIASYRGRSSAPDRLASDEDLGRRSAEHAEVVGLLVDLGHRLGMSVAVAEREAGRLVRGRPLGERLTSAEREAPLPSILRAPSDVVSEVDCAWYVRSRGVFLFEVEWTAIVSDVLLRRHARIPNVERLVRFLVVAPERAELLRLKLARSPLLRGALARDNWHILTWENLGAFAAREAPSLEDLEPYLGLGEPDTGDQLALFD